MVRARWHRNWDRYWTFRKFARDHWPVGAPVPEALTERVWPQAVYRVKDTIDAAVGRWKQLTASQPTACRGAPLAKV